MTPSMTVSQRMAVSQRIVSQQTSAIALLPWLGVALSCLVRLLRPGCWSTAISYHFARASKGGLAPRGAHHKPPLRSGRGVQKASHPHGIRKGTANQKLSVQQHKIGEPRTAESGRRGKTRDSRRDGRPVGKTTTPFLFCTFARIIHTNLPSLVRYVMHNSVMHYVMHYRQPEPRA